MKNRLYVFFDRVKVEAGPIYQFKNDSEALRQFDHLIQRIEVDEKAVVRPEHLQLLFIGEFDTEKGEGGFCKPSEVIINVNLEDDE